MKTNINYIDEKLNEAKNIINEFEKFGFQKNGFCLVPFTTIILEPNGNVGVCRLHGTDKAIGSLNNNTIEEIWNGTHLKKWRREFLDGKPEICKNQIKNKNCNLCIENNKLLNSVEFNETQTTPIQKLTANFNGFCNLKCIMCDVWTLPNGYYNEQNFWGPARTTIFPFLKEIDMLSGEPFLQADTYKLIKEVSRVNTKCKWSITTNAHWKLNQSIKGHLDLIDIKNLIISIDSVNTNTYSNIRKGGKLDVVLKNVEHLLDYQEQRLKNNKSSLNIYVNFLVQKENWNEISDMIQYCISNEIMPFISFCERPEEYSLLDYDEKLRIEILEFYFSNLTKVELFFSLRVIRPLIFSLPAIFKADFLTRLNDMSFNDTYLPVVNF